MFARPTTPTHDAITDHSAVPTRFFRKFCPALKATFGTFWENKYDFCGSVDDCCKLLNEIAIALKSCVYCSSLH